MNDVNKNLGHATAYGYAKSKGYTGTEEEFSELMADYAEVGERAEQAATAAAASATAASGSYHGNSKGNGSNHSGNSRPDRPECGRERTDSGTGFGSLSGGISGTGGRRCRGNL